LEPQEVIFLYIKNLFIGLYEHKYLIQELVTTTVKKRYRRSVLGVVWSVLNPLLTMLVTALIFSGVFRADIENYLLYVLSGQIIYNFFVESTSVGMQSVIANSSLIKQVRVPKYIFPLASVSASCVNLLFSLPALILILLATGAKLHFAILSFVVPLFILLLFCIGCSFFLATVAIFFRDILSLYGIVTRLLFYVTPIFYPATMLSEKRAAFVKFNPMFYFVNACRAPLYQGVLPTLHQLVPCLVLAFVAIVLGSFVFIKNQNKFILYV
jgi:ABC-type polysaccharide/polyol phosphate export permease